MNGKRNRCQPFLALVLSFGSAINLWSQNQLPRQGDATTPHAKKFSEKQLLQPPPPPPFQGITHTSWTRRDGAPGDITSLAQTKDGYLWVGSSLSLYRFDGLRFALYPFESKNSTLPSLNVCSLAADLEGGLWVAMCNATIIHLKADGKAVLFGKKEGVTGSTIEKIYSLPDGSVWTSCSARLQRLEGDRWVDFGKSHGIGPDGVFSILFDREGNIWVGRDKRLSVLRKGTSQLQDVPNPAHYVSSMVQSRNGEIWISDAWRSVHPLSDSSPAGVLHLQGKAEMLVDTDDNLWIAQDDEGLSRIQHISDSKDRWVIELAEKNDLSAPQTRALLQDREGNIWVGTERGLDRFRETPFVHFRSTQLRYFPSLIAGDDGSVWINSHGSPLMQVRDGVTTPVGDHVNTGPLAKRRNGDICFIDLTSYQLQCYGKSGVTFTKLPSNLLHNTPPLTLVEDIDGALLLSFQGGGFWRLFDGKWSPMKDAGAPSSSPWAMLSDSQGRLWLGYGTDNTVERKDGIFRTLHVDEAPWSNTLTFYEAAGTIWVGGSNGLSFLDGDHFKPVHSLQPNLLQGTSGIVRDQDGNLWLNAGAGVLRISTDEVALLMQHPDHMVKVDVFDENDGLVGQPTQFKRSPSAIADMQGTLWFAMGGEVVSLDPSKLRQGRKLPGILIENVLIDGKPGMDAPGRPGAVLKTDAAHLHDLEISYIGINLSAPERVYYRYRLVGEDSNWQEAGMRRQAFYTRLNPGSYQFLVSASTGEGWSDLPVPLRIEVKPAIYQTWWFKVLCGVAFLTVVWLLYRARLRFETEQVHSRLSERLAERERVARELHDTLLQGFQGLMMRFHLATQSMPSSSAARSEMETALDSADLLLIESRDRIRDLRYEAVDPVSLADSLTTLGEEYPTPHIWDFRVDVLGVQRDLNPISHQEIYAIAKEAVLNAFRHSGASTIRVDLVYEETRFCVRISDNGKGIRTESISDRGGTDHWGIPGMYERSGNLDADLKICRLQTGGTEVRLSVPAAIAYERAFKTLGKLAKA